MNRSFIILTFAFLSITLVYSVRAKTQEINTNSINKSYQADYNYSSLNTKSIDLNLELDALNNAYIESDMLSYLDVAQHLINDFIRKNPPNDESTYVVSFDTLTSIVTTVALIEDASDHSNGFILAARGWLKEYLNFTLPLRDQTASDSVQPQYVQAQGLLMELNHSVDFHYDQDLSTRKIAERNPDRINPEVYSSSIRL
ncbi:hypothetical protein [Vibrio agarivorans]|uniref:hypothetical protein n=1 Tax=Vibrio agarivorans TaxID=153622 RepID=UPI00222EDA59|nr:hypothetical protein [Vibrio agarivorans]MDN3660275.1 hypothetical protein [Vibrio agarivorans]